LSHEPKCIQKLQMQSQCGLTNVGILQNVKSIIFNPYTEPLGPQCGCVCSLYIFLTTVSSLFEGTIFQPVLVYSTIAQLTHIHYKYIT